LKKGKIARAKGFHDILPKDQKYFEHVKFTALKHFRVNGYERIDVPTLEKEALFQKGTGADTTIVQKEMFLIPPKEGEGETLAMRPEATPGVARAYVEHGMLNLPQPVMLYYLGPMFRRESPQKGRFREFWQFGCEVLGTTNPSSDTQVIKMAWDIIEDAGVKNAKLVINSIGCKGDRANIKEVLASYFEKKRGNLCPDCKVRLKTNPFRILDCKEKSCQEIASDAPQIIDQLCASCRNDLKKVLEFLDELKIPYDMNPGLVRGLDYYTKTVFEIVLLDDTSRQNTLIGGGRYDQLIELYGGKETGAVGWAAGLDRIVGVLKDQKAEIEDPYKPQVFLAQLGEPAKKKSFSLLSDLQKEGIGVRAALSKDSLRSQLRLANKFKVKLTLILGQKELQDKTLIIRDMEEGIQEIVKQKESLEYIKNKLK
jgi:histidyl-tRNA synthetase